MECCKRIIWFLKGEGEIENDGVWYHQLVKRLFILNLLLISVLILLCYPSFAAEENPPSNTEMTASSVVYKIHADQSKFVVRTGTAGLLGFVGHEHLIEAREFTGEITVTPEGIASLRMVVKTASLVETGEFDKKDTETIQTRLHENVMESSKYPEILFQSTEVSYSKKEGDLYEATIRGELDLHGEKRNIVIPAQFRYNETSFRATGAFEINRDDFKIKAESAGGGTVKVAKKVDITFDIIAHQ